MEENVTLEEARKILGFKTIRSVKSFVRGCRIKITSMGDDPLLDLIKTDDFCRAIRINSLPERFLQIKEVAKMLNISSGQIMSLAQEDIIPYYRFSRKKGSRLLFVKEEIEDFINIFPEISIIKNRNYHSFIWRHQQYETIIQRWLLAIKDQSDSFHIFWDLLFGNRSIEELAKERGLTVERIKQIFNRKLRGMYFNPLIHLDKVAHIKKENIRLNIEINILKGKLGEVDVLSREGIEDKVNTASFLAQKIKHSDFSLRTFNIIKRFEMDTLGELFFDISPVDFLKARGCGKKILEEVDNFFKLRGLDWKNKKVK